MNYPPVHKWIITYLGTINIKFCDHLEQFVVFRFDFQQPKDVSVSVIRVKQDQRGQDNRGSCLDTYDNLLKPDSAYNSSPSTIEKIPEDTLNTAAKFVKEKYISVCGAEG